MSQTKLIVIVLLLTTSISQANASLIKATQTTKRPRILQKVDTGSNSAQTVTSPNSNSNEQQNSSIKQAPEIDPTKNLPGMSYKLTGMERWIWGALYTLIGFPLCFFGKKWWGLFGPILGAVTGILIGNFIEGQAINLIHSNKPGVSETWSWIFFVGTIALAGVMAIIFVCAKTIIGSLVGGTLGLLSSQLVLTSIANYNNGVSLVWWAQWIIMAILVITGILIGCCISDFVILISCCVTGAWIFTCGIGSLIGQFPYNYTKTVLPAWIYWVYFAGFCIMTVIGMIIQCNEKKRSDLEGKSCATVY